MSLRETALFDAIEATWPAAALHSHGPWLVREGRGGGKRVSSVSAVRDWEPDDIPAAEAALASAREQQLRLGLLEKSAPG